MLSLSRTALVGLVASTACLGFVAGQAGGTQSFAPTCPKDRLFLTSFVSVDYQLGTVGGEDAVQFHLTFNPDSGSTWGAVGFKQLGSFGMNNMDVVAVEAGRDQVGDFWAPGFGMPDTDSSNDVTFVRRVGNEYVFVRKLQTGDDRDQTLVVDTLFDAAWAMGSGTPFGGPWNYHGPNRATVPGVQLRSCPKTAPDTPAPCVDSPDDVSVTMDGVPLAGTPAFETMDGWEVNGARAQLTEFIEVLKRPGVRAFFPPQSDGVPVGTNFEITCPANCDNTRCEAVFIVYHCPPCSDPINGNLPVELSGWIPAQCSVHFTLDGQPRVYTAASFYKRIPAGTTETLPSTVELLAHTAIFARKNANPVPNLCGAAPPPGIPGKPKGPAVCTPCPPRPSQATQGQR